MTSLQKQLATISATSSHELDLKAQKSSYSKSLLFEPRVAATQSLDTLFQICYEGFEELRTLDPRFSNYERSIFSTQSLNEDRTQLSSEENVNLDKVLHSFLCLIGGKLLLKPALKAVEWLVRRFRIHELNTSFTILTFLPYHELPIFTTLLSILPNKLSPTFKFLHPYMHSLKNPPRSAIVFTTIHNANFRSSLNQYVLSASKAGFQYTMLLSFWASLSAQAVDGILNSSSSGRQDVQQQREEDLLMTLLPTLDEALTIRRVPELALGCYMIMTILVSKADLADKTIDSLMLTIVSTWSKDIQEPGISCLGVLARFRSTTKFPKQVSKALLKINHLSTKISALSEQESIQALILGVIQESIDRLHRADNSNPTSFVKFALMSAVLNESQKSILLGDVFRKFKLEMGSLDANPRFKSALIDIFSTANSASGVQDLVRVHTANDSATTSLAENALGFSFTVVEDDTVELGVFSTDSELLDQPLQSPIVLLSDIGNIAEKKSFLVPAAPTSLERLVSVFSKITSSPASLQQFEQLPLLQLDRIIESPVFLSFFLLVSSSKYSTTMRLAALKIMAQQISRVSGKNTDFQALLPYIIIALTDTSIKVRRTAAELVLVLRDSKSSKNSSTERSQNTVWGYDSLYGCEASNISWMSSKDSDVLIDKILYPSLEECISDPHQVAHVLHNSLDSSKHSNDGEGQSYFRPKNSQKTSIFKFLSSQIDYLPIHCRSRFLSVLNETKKIAGQPRSIYLLPSLKKWAAHDEISIETHLLKDSVDVSELDKEYLGVVRPADEEATSFLISLITSDSKPRDALRTAAYGRLGKLWPLLKDSQRETLSVQILNIAVPSIGGTMEEQIQQEAIGFFRKVQMIPACLIVLIKEATRAFESEIHTHKSKRRRTSFNRGNRLDLHSGLDSNVTIRRLTLVLEVVDGSKHSPDPNLFQALFGVLQVIQDYKNRSTSDLGYLQVLAISNMLLIMEKLQVSSIAKLDVSTVRMDILVECVRKSSNPDVRNSALLLLGAFAKYAPQSILHSIMPVFTLMTTTTVQQSDEYSAHVVDETVREVIPLLAGTLRKQNKDLISAVAEILQSFAAAFKHIPPHRRLRLFTLLAESLGPEDSLFAVIATLINGFPEDSQVDRFARTLLSQFNAVDTLNSICKYLGLVLDGLNAEPELSKILLVRKSGAESQDDPLANLMAPISGFLEDQILVAKVNQDLQERPETASDLRILFGSLLARTIDISKASVGRQLLHGLSQQALRSLINLLPPDVIVELVAPLLDEKDEDFRQSLLTLIKDRLDAQSVFEKKAQLSAIKLLPRLAQMVQESNNIALKSAAIACIDQIIEKVGKGNTTAVLEVAQTISSDTVLLGEDMLPVLALHCLASMVDVLHNEFIPLVQQTLKDASVILARSLNQDEKRDFSGLHNAAYSFFTSVITHIPMVIPGTSLCAIFQLSHEAAALPLGDLIFDARSNTLLQMAIQVEPNALFTAMDSTFESAYHRGYEAFEEHLKTFQLAVQHRSKSVVTRHASKLFDIFLKAIDLRRRKEESAFQGKYSDEQLELLEKTAIESMIALVLKINDGIFRPLFVRLVNWATESPGNEDQNGSVFRSIAMFNAVLALSERLKSIITSYYGFLLDSTVQILQMPLSYNAEIRTLWKSALFATISFCKYDEDDFWQSPAHFDTIVRPLLSKLEQPATEPHGTMAIAAITELASAAASNEHHRNINTILIQLTKADSSKTRLAAVKCQRSLTEKLGDEWLNLLPEMLPAINELQEDDDEDVERETLIWIKMIEGILGESLDSMLH